MVADPDLISGREALQRLDEAVERARGDFSVAQAAADGSAKRRSDVLRLRAEGYRELARIRLDVLKAGADVQLTAAETKAVGLLDQHASFVSAIDADVEKADAVVVEIEARRRSAAAAADTALHAYEMQVAATETRLKTDPAYLGLKTSWEEAKAVSARSAQKLDLARSDRTEKGAPYEADPLFAYLWGRKFRTTDYHFGGLTRMMDGWVAKTCGYDAAYLNYARLVELPDRLAEHAARVKLEEAESGSSIGRFESAALEADGASALAATLKDMRGVVARIDADLAAAEAARSDLRGRQEKAVTGESGPQDEARRLIEDSLVKASFPELKVLAAETTTLDDDRIVDNLVRLRTEELQMEINWRNVEAQPTRRASSVDALEQVRQRFKQGGLESVYVAIDKGAFGVAVLAYGGANPDGEALWRAIVASVRQAPGPDDTYFGGPRRGRSIGLSPVEGMLVGAVLGQVLGGGRHWGGGWGGGGGGFGGGGFGGGGGGFSTGGQF